MNSNPCFSVVRTARLLAGAGAAVFLLGVSHAAQPVVRTEDNVVVARPALKRADRDFMEKAAKAGMEEVEISRVAAARTSNPNVKELAQMIVADHEGANEELATLAAAKNVSLPAKDAAFAEKWSKHKASDFDRDYLDKMVNAHEDAVKLFDRQARNGDDPEAVAFARKHLPALQHHLQQALDLKKALK
jgi:putative membrane protein